MLTELRDRPIRYYTRHLVVLLSAVVMLFAFAILTPWQSINPAQLVGATQAVSGGTSGDSEQGFQMPNGFDLSNLPEGFQPPAGFDPTNLPDGFQLSGGFDPANLPDGFEPPAGFPFAQGNISAPTGDLASQFGGTNPLQALVPIAALLSLGFAMLSAIRPNVDRWSRGLTFIAGLASLASFIPTFALNSLVPIDLLASVNIGFWLAIVGSLGLIIQVVIPQMRLDDVDETDVREIVPDDNLGRGGLSIPQNISIAVDALMANKLRSGLTMLGIIIGVGSVVSLISIGQGATVAVTSEIEGTGLNQVTVLSGSNTGNGGPPGINLSNAQTITYDDALALEEQLDDVTAVLPQYSTTLRIRSDQDNIQASVLGTVEDYALASDIALDIGRYFSESEYDNNARVAILGQNAAQDLFGGLNPLDRAIRIDGTRFEVIGVLEEQDGGFGTNPNDQIYIPLTTGYRNLFDTRVVASNDNYVSSITVVAMNSDAVPGVEQHIETILRSEHRLELDEDNDFSVQNQQTLLDTASTITGILTVLLGAISSISLLVGGIGIMNIMLVSVKERTKEIGLRKAIGARRGQILQQFLIETIVLSVLGGVIGVSMGVGISWIVNASGIFTTVISIDSILLGLVFSALVGCFFGIYPANQAASLQPIEALRYE